MLNEPKITYLQWKVSKLWFGLSSAFTWRALVDQVRFRSASVRPLSSSRSNGRGLTDHSSPVGLSHIHVVFYRHETTENVFAEVEQVPPFRMTWANVNGSGVCFSFHTCGVTHLRSVCSVWQQENAIVHIIRQNKRGILSYPKKEFLNCKRSPNMINDRNTGGKFSFNKTVLRLHLVLFKL